MTAASILLYTDRTLLPSSKSDRVAAYLYAHTSEVRKQQRTIQDIVTIAGGPYTEGEILIPVLL